MYPLKKGKTTSQAHVGLPEGTYEEEHGRKGFYGKSAHLYHAHPPTGWIRFEGKLRPHCFDLNQLKPSDENDAEGMPLAFLGNNDIRLLVSRRSEAMPFYFRNADGDELYFVHRGHGKIETDFGPLDYEAGDYINIPRAVTYRVIPETRDNFFLIIESKHEFEQPEKGLLGQHALYDPATVVTPEPRAAAGRSSRVGDPHQSRRRDFKSSLSFQSDRCSGLEGRPDRVEDQHARHSSGDEPSRPSASQRAHYIRHRRRRGV
jgi:homogentisate 1,2-dioxygenase